MASPITIANTDHARKARSDAEAWITAGAVPTGSDGKHQFSELVKAAWCLLVARRDCFLRYYPRGGETAVCTVTREWLRRRNVDVGDGDPVLTPWELADHFARKKGPRNCIGLHFLNDSSFGKAVAFDIDAHDARTPELLARNAAYANLLYARLAAMGALPWLIDHGAGSYHLLVPFSHSVRGDVLYHFGRSVVADAEDHGFPQGVESFPKQEHVSRYGGALRLFGLHHTRPEWARVFSGTAWLAGLLC